MRKKTISLILIIVITIGLLLSYVTSYATYINSNSIFVNLTKADANKIGYGIGNLTSLTLKFHFD